MSKLDAYEREVLTAYESGKLKSIATKRELEKLKAAMPVGTRGPFIGERKP